MAFAEILVTQNRDLTIKADLSSNTYNIVKRMKILSEKSSFVNNWLNGKFGLHVVATIL